MAMRKLKKYTPTRFKAKDSHYDKAAADYAVMFIESLCHTKGTWAGQPFELIDWQEQIIRDLFGIPLPGQFRLPSLGQRCGAPMRMVCAGGHCVLSPEQGHIILPVFCGHGARNYLLYVPGRVMNTLPKGHRPRNKFWRNRI